MNNNKKTILIHPREDIFSSKGILLNEVENIIIKKNNKNNIISIFLISLNLK